MRRIINSDSIRLTVAIAAFAVVALPGLAAADHHEGGDVAAEIKAVIMESNEYTQMNLMDQEGGVSKHGSLEFWSSGGLMQWAPPDVPTLQYEHFSITPKHIKVIELPGGEAAVAMYYSEGAMQLEGGEMVSHYMTRVLQVYVKEDGEWVVRAAHWSPIAGGSGTRQTAID